MSLLAAAGRIVDQIKINTLERHTRDERTVWTKRRRASAQIVVPLANRFFQLAGNPVTILHDVRAWHEWEISSMHKLHGGEFTAWTDQHGTLHVEELPGQSISQHLDAGTASEAMFAASAREFRRVHAIECGWFRSGWSHGDPHSGNVIFDAANHRARLLDFEVRHDATLSADARHTDDLLVFLQDSLGRLPRNRWLEFASVFVRSYDRPSITARLVERLDAPRGMARIWWAIRTTYLSQEEVTGRLHALREVLAT